MLTKDLILCTANRGGLRPRFLDSGEPRLLALAERLLGVFRQSPPPTRGEIATQTAIPTGSSRELKILRGLTKLLMDRCEFGHDTETDFAALRRGLLGRAAVLLAAGDIDGLQRYRQAVVAQSAEPDPDRAAMTLYADLPENERLLRFRDLGPRELLERYNVGLVQGLLLRADRLVVLVGSPDPARMRRLFRYLKFFRLLVRVTVVGESGGSPGAEPSATPRRVRLEIDGPTSLFDQPRRYGLQLASFFPALCSLEEWALEAEVEWRGKKRLLRLDQRAGLVGPYRHFGAYVPEEIRLFERRFRETVSTWRITDERPCLRVRGQELVFPDFSFRDAEGRVLHLELFHRWHAGPLRERLRSLSETPDLPLIIGIDRNLAGDESEAPPTQTELLKKKYAFLFRDYPTVAKTVGCLDAKAADFGG